MFRAHLRSRWRGIFRRSQVEQEMASELQFHIEARAADLVTRHGLSREEATRRARVEFGSLEQCREDARANLGLRLLEDIRVDLRHTVRSFRKSPSFPAVTVLTLAVAIGAAITIFTLMNAVLLRKLPVPDPEQLVHISLLTRSGEPGGLSLVMFEELERRQNVFSGLVVFAGDGVLTVEAGGGFRLANEWAVSGNFYQELGHTPLIGRLLDTSDIDLRSGAFTPAVVLGHGFWRQWFAADPNVIGRELRIEGHPFTVVGVTRPGVGGLGIGEPEITMPLHALSTALGMPPSALHDRRRASLSVVGRLRAGVTIDQARAWLAAVRPELLRSAMPATYTLEEQEVFLNRRFDVTSAARGIDWFLRTRFTRPLWALFGMVGVMLLIACAHLAGLMLARTAARRQEVAMRLALGATRWRVGRQILLESVLLSVCGAALGLWLAFWGSSMLAGFMTQQYLVVPRIDLAPDRTVLGMTLTIAVAAGVLFGLASLWFVIRQDHAVVIQAHPARVAAGTGAIGKSLIVVQVALSVVLLTGAGLIVRTLTALRSADAGFDTEGVLVTRLMPRPGGYDQFQPQVYYRDLLTRVGSLPGVQRASLSTTRPGNSYGVRDTFGGLTAERWPVSPGFFATVQMQLLAGRDFQWNDDGERPPVAIISRNLAARLFPEEEPIGQRIRGVNDAADLEVVGVVADAQISTLKPAAPYVVYQPALQQRQFRQPILLVRISADTAGVRAAISSAIEGLSREYAHRIHTLDDAVGQGLVAERLSAAVAGFFALLALGLAAIGLYSLISYSVTRRTREIGIRIALGANRRSIGAAAVRDGVVLTVIGIAVGTPASFALTGAIAGILVGISPRDPLTTAVVGVVMLVTASISAIIPARRATRVDPMVALRCE